ncbi:Tll0287-like domain-containing protein [Rubricoccus marinus]|uniref:Tll0287-like domain-containing protein n=1 Tax=Rubricoccus marinus TaxID=716817 RepID=UPI001C52C24D|nr:DUF3365 domain-containing protein [Rubricoccus marinus]
MTARAALVLLVLAGCASEPSSPADGPPPTEAQTPEEARVEAAVAAIDSMRAARAASISPDETVDAETFARVCKPVGMRARALADSTGWTVRQAAIRFRNPANAATPAEAALHERFEADPALAHVWADAPGGRLYARRITVTAGCAACHGPRDDRPAFVAERYPDDRAYGFQPGDLRGVYAVFVPAQP